MKFVFEKLLPASRKNVVCVDGYFESELNLSHWPGNTTPRNLKADTSTEIAFNLIESDMKEQLLNGIEIVSNNHFDADGVLAAYTILFPESALKFKKEFIDIATTGDFLEFTTEDAMKAEIVIRNIEDPGKSLFKNEFKEAGEAHLLNALYLKTFDSLAEIITNIDEYEEHFEEDLKLYNKSESAFKSHQALFSNYGDCNLSVIESGFPVHPISKFGYSEFDIVLTAITGSGGTKYELEYKPHTWHDTTRLKRIKRRTFEPLSKKMNLIEKNKKGLWKIYGENPIKDWNYKMNFSDENNNLVSSELPIHEVEEILFDYFFD